jgi:hypothetical protein
MALSLSSPGISIKEVDLTTGSVNATSPLAAGLAAPFAKGPVEEVVEIRTEKNLLNIFGPPSKEDYHYEYWYSASNFLSYGGSLKVVRADSENLKNSNAAVGSASANIKIKNYENYQSQISSNYYWAAKNPGYWAEGIKVCVIDNFADQTLVGINTSGITVGAGITQSISNNEVLKGIVSGIGQNEIYVKVTNKISAGGTETSQDYTERGTYSFSTSNQFYVNGSLGAGVTAVSVTRQALGSTLSTSILNQDPFDLLNVVSTTSVDMSGSNPFESSDGQLFLSNTTGITTASYLGIGSFILRVSSVTNIANNNVGVTTTGEFNTTKVTVPDGTTVKVYSYRQDYVRASAAGTASATTINLDGLGTVTQETVSAGDLLVATNGEVIQVNSVSTSGVVSPTSVNDWYNTQYVLNTANGDSQSILWKSIAPRPRTNQYVLERGGSNDSFHVAVIDSKLSSNVSGTSQQILEVFRNVSKASDTMISPSENVYYKNYLALNSNYIYAGAVLGTDSYWGVSEVASAFSSGFTPVSTTLGNFGQEATGVKFNSIGNKSFTLTGGRDYSAGTNQVSNIGGFEVDFGQITSAIDKLSNPNEVEFNFLLQGSASGSIDVEQAKANYLISIAENRKDCIAFISPYRSATVNVSSESVKLDNVIKFFSPLTSSSYAVFDSGYQYVYDRFNKEFVYMPCSADIAGLCVRTDINQHPWFSPAGKIRGTLKNVIKLSYNPNQDDRDELYSNRINPVINYPGSGVILYGDKTALSYSSAFDRINVRRLFITIEQAIRSAADAQLFEFNDAATRANFVNIVEPYLRDVQAKRGITDFLLVCDETNNTPDVIDRNEFIADIYVKPARSINFIGLTFIATRTGVSFETVVGTV